MKKVKRGRGVWRVLLEALGGGCVFCVWRNQSNQENNPWIEGVKERASQMKNELVSDIERVSMGRRRRKKAYLSAIIILLINYLKKVETTVINMMSALHTGNCYFIHLSSYYYWWRLLQGKRVWTELMKAVLSSAGVYNSPVVTCTLHYTLNLFNFFSF